MRWRVPGSWERSCLGEIDSPHSRTLPSQAPEGFLLPERACLEFPGASRNERPGSQGSRGNARAPKARGLPEGTRRKPDTKGGADLEGFAKAARPQERRDIS